jgi:hypothetical protein
MASLSRQTALTLATRAVVQALMDINIAIKAEVLLAFWTADMQIRLASCKHVEDFVNEPDDYNT